MWKIRKQLRVKNWWKELDCLRTQARAVIYMYTHIHIHTHNYTHTTKTQMFSKVIWTLYTYTYKHIFYMSSRVRTEKSLKTYTENTLLDTLDTRKRAGLKGKRARM